ncbi:putative ribonuclease H-like domain-containing protein [Tanacetum coccineum]
MQAELLQFKAPTGFKDPDHPDKVYKVVKALYVLHQAPKAWHETLANYLLGNGFKKGKIDQTLFIKKQKGDILLVQVTQREDGIFISQDKYVAEILKKFNYTDVKSASTPVDLEKPLVKDIDADDVDVHLYRSMIESLMYLTASRLDIMFVVCVCARFQVTPKTSNLLAIKRIFRYLKGKPTLGLWYSRDSPFELVAYTDSDYAGATQDKKSTTRVASGQIFATNTTCGLNLQNQRSDFQQIVDFLNASHIQYALIENPKIYVSLIQQFWGTATARTTDDGEVEITASIDGQVKTITEASLIRHLKFEDSDGITSLPNTEIFEQLALMGYVSDSARLTFQKGHFSPQWRFFIHTILHCLSPKTTAWEQFSSNIATAIICLAINRTFNFSKMIFDAMVKNLDSTHKFLMYPRFLKIYLNKQKRLLQPYIRTYPTPTLTQKLFSNMKRVSKGYSGVEFPLFPTMITAPESSPSRITSSPSLSPQSHQSSPLRDITRQAARRFLRSKNRRQRFLKRGRQSKSVKGSVINPSISTSSAKEIDALKKRIQRLERRKKSRPTSLKRLRKVGMSQRVESYEDQESLGVAEDASEQGRSFDDIDVDVDVSLVNETQER